MVVSVILVATAVALLTGSGGRQRLRTLGRSEREHGPSGATATGDQAGSRWWASPLLAAMIAIAASLLVIGPPTGLVVGLVAGVAAYSWVARAEGAADRRHREQLEQDLPLAVDLLVACLSVGRAPTTALVAVAAAVRGPVAAELRAVTARLDMGADALTVWRDVAQHPALGPLGRSFARSNRSGSSVTAALSRCAGDLRRRRRSAAQARARSVGVKAAGPLGLCFLPAFMLVGIVPTIISLFSGVLG